MKQSMAAQVVWDALRDAGADGLSFTELMDETGLSGNQVRHGLKYVDDVLQVREGRPRAWHPYRKVYTLSETWAEHRPYIDVRWKSILTQMERQERNLTASLAKYGHDIAAVGEITAKATSVRAAIRDIEDAMFGPSTSTSTSAPRRVVRRARRSSSAA